MFYLRSIFVPLATCSTLPTLTLSLADVLFDWFSPPVPHSESDSFPPPPTPLVFRSSLASFWPNSVADSWLSFADHGKIYDVVCASALPNFLHARVPLPSGLNIPRWRSLLADYPDPLLGCCGSGTRKTQEGDPP